MSPKAETQEKEGPPPLPLRIKPPDRLLSEVLKTEYTLKGDPINWSIDREGGEVVGVMLWNIGMMAWNDVPYAADWTRIRHWLGCAAEQWLRTHGGKTFKVGRFLKWLDTQWGALPLEPTEQNQ